LAGVAESPNKPQESPQVPVVSTTQAPIVEPIVAEEEQPMPPMPPTSPENPPTVILVPTPGTEVSLGPGHGCSGKGFVGDPTNCRVYYRCEWGTKTTYVCPEGLHYDYKLNLCNWPERAGCQKLIPFPEKLALTPLQQFLLRMQSPFFRMPDYISQPLQQYTRQHAEYLAHPYQIHQPYFFRQTPNNRKLF
jgi:hypothetical protein